MLGLYIYGVDEDEWVRLDCFCASSQPTPRPPTSALTDRTYATLENRAKFVGHLVLNVCSVFRHFSNCSMNYKIS